MTELTGIRVGLICASCLFVGTAVAQSPVTLAIDTRSPGLAIAPHFIGLSFGPTALVDRVFTSTNTQMASIFQDLGIQYFRMGGTEVDTTTNAENTAYADDLFGFIAAAGLTDVIYSLKLGYAIKAMDLGGHGNVEPITMTNSSGLNLTAYAVAAGTNLYVTIINKENGTSPRDASVTISINSVSSGTVSAVYLVSTNGSLEATNGITLGGTVLSKNAPWSGQWTTLAPLTNGQCTVPVSAASAAIVRIQAGVPFISAGSPARLLTSEGFGSLFYSPGTSPLGTNILSDGLDGPWTGFGSVTIMTNSLLYVGYGAEGENHLQLSGTAAVQRYLLSGDNGPLGNYIDTNGCVSLSRDGTPLYLAFLMRVPTNGLPHGAFLLSQNRSGSNNTLLSLYTTTTGSTQEFLASVTNASNQPKLLGLNTGGTNLLVTCFDFSPGQQSLRIWLNPPVGGPEPPPNASFAPFNMAFDQIGLARDGGGLPLEFDEMRFGNDWSNTTSGAGLATLPGDQGIVGISVPPPSPLGGTNYPRQFFPFVDGFGQYRFLEWSNKVHSIAELQRAAVLETNDLKANPRSADWDSWGGWQSGPKLAATGLFRVQKFQGKWWLVDPDGRLFWSNGMDSSDEPSDENSGWAGVTERTNYYSDLPLPGSATAPFLFKVYGNGGYYQGKKAEVVDFFQADAALKYGTTNLASLTNLVFTRLASWQMNTIGFWTSSNSYTNHALPYVVVVSADSSSTLNGGLPDYFDPGFEATLRTSIPSLARNDPWCIGFSVGNELPWTSTSGGGISNTVVVGLETLASTNGTFAKVALSNQLHATYATIANLNGAWGTTYSSWNDFMSATNQNPVGNQGDADLNPFYSAYARKFFSTCKFVFTNANYCSNLFLGCKFINPFPAAAAASIPYVDVETFDNYQSIAHIPESFSGVDRPFWVGEYSFSCADSGLYDGLAMEPDQNARATNYVRHFQAAIVDPRLVGTHWFRLRDWPVTGGFNGNNAERNTEFGFVSVTDTPYNLLVTAARQSGATMYPVRLNDLTISTIPNQRILRGGTDGPLPFTITGDQTPAANLILTVASSNPSVIPMGNIVLGGSGSNRTISLLASSTTAGSTQIKITITDALGVSAFTSFSVLVLPGPPPPHPPFRPGGIKGSGGKTLKISSGTAGSSAVTGNGTFFQIDHAQWSGGNLILTGRGGPVGSTGLYCVLESTNLGLPEWTRVATNSFKPDGTFRFAIPSPSTSHHALFYKLELP